MLRLDKVIKPWKESAALNDHINLYGFWTETAFLTKSGDLGMVLSVPGVDYESLDRSEQEYAVKRLEAALKAFGLGFHVYQYLFKPNRPDIPFAKYDDPIVEAAIDQRRKLFEAKRDHLYQVEIFYCILLEGARSKTGVGTALARLLRDPEGAIAELKSQFTNDNMKKLLRTHIDRDLQRLDQHVQAFARQLADFMQILGIDRAVEHLVVTPPPKERACVLLKDVFDYSLEEIAELVDSTVGGVKAALNRARTKLAASPAQSKRSHAASPELMHVMQLYVERFNRRDWDGVRELISADARLNVADAFAGRLAEAPYFSNWGRWTMPWRLAMGEVDGESAVVILQRGFDTWTPYSVVRMNVIGQQIQQIIDYAHCPWVLPSATTVMISEGLC